MEMISAPNLPPFFLSRRYLELDFVIHPTASTVLNKLLWPILKGLQPVSAQRTGGVEDVLVQQSQWRLFDRPSTLR